jgi:hypothetical protein
LLCTAHRICSNILLRWLSSYVEGTVGGYQCGFRQGRSNSDQTIPKCQNLAKCNEFQTETQHILIDFWSAYDSTDQDNLIMAMEEMHIPRKWIPLVRATMGDLNCQIMTQNMLSRPAITGHGVQQGDSPACLLFNTEVEKVITEVGINMWGTIWYKSVQILAHANDMDMPRITGFLDFVHPPEF